MFSRSYNEALEGKITKVLRSVAADEAKARGSNKTRKVKGFKFPKLGAGNVFRMD